MGTISGMTRVAATTFLVLLATIQPLVAQSPELKPSASQIERVNIGTQIWMKENYSGTNFRNGDPIARVDDAAAWTAAGESGTAAYSTYSSQTPPPAKWGLLYNFAAISDERGICPEGWRVPNNRDWRVLEEFLGGGAQAADALKADRGWPGTNGGSNSSGFSGLPAGWRTQSGIFYLGGRIGYFWTSDVSPDGTVLSHMIFDVARPIFRIGYNPGMGQSLRCITESEANVR